MILCRSFLILGVVFSCAPQSATQTPCQLVTLTGKISSGDRFEKPIGQGLSFRLLPIRLGPEGELNGWGIGLTPESDPHADYVYPVNPPIRFNGLQILGPSYGEDAKASLGHTHEMRFLLDERSYQRISPLLRNAL